jgi:type II secretory pathway pseudopilin PulG
MIELLVVVTIIAVLMTLVVRVVGQFLTMARDAATKSTLSKAQGILDSRAQYLGRLALRRGYVSGSSEMYDVNQDPVLQNLPQATKNIIAVKDMELKYFPQGVVELGGSLFNNKQYPIYGPLIDTYRNTFCNPQPPGQNISNISQYQASLDANHTLRSSEILYHFLTQSTMLGGTPVGLDAFSAAEVKDSDNNGLPELIDAWGSPLRFYRWPTRFFRSAGMANGAIQPITTPANPPLVPSAIGPNPDGSYDTNNAKLLFTSLPIFSGNLAADLNRDPDDPLRNCISVTGFEQRFHTPATYHAMLIVSAGPDGELGIYEPDDLANFGNLAQPIPGRQDALTDNITYLNIRAGGK